MNIRNRLKRLESERPQHEGAIAVFITTYEGKAKEEDDIRYASLFWEGAGSISIHRGEGEDIDQFRQRIERLREMKFADANAAQEATP